MSEETKNIDKLFKEGLKGHKHPAPINAWNRLDEDLSRSAARKKFVYFRWIAAAALILLAFGSGYFFGIYKVSNNTELAKNDNVPNKTTPTEIIDSKEPTTQSETNHELRSKSILPLTIPERIIVQNTDREIIIENFDITESLDSESRYVSGINSMDKIPALSLTIIEKVSDLSDDKLDIIPKHETDVLKKEILAQNTYLTGDYDYGDKVKKEPKWALGAQFAPVVSYRDISISYEYGQPGNINDTESELNEIEDPLISYAGGVDVNYDVSSRWSFQSGMYFSRIGQVNNEALNFKQENNQFLLYAINTSTGDISISFETIPDHVKQFESQKKDTIQSVNLENVRVVQNFDLFEIPFLVKYRILDKKFGISLSGGLSPAYLLKNSTILEVDNDKYDIGNSDNLNTMIVNTTLGLGLNYTVSNKISLNLEPTFKYSLSPINKNSQFNYHPYYFSWFTGIRYRF